MAATNRARPFPPTQDLRPMLRLHWTPSKSEAPGARAEARARLAAVVRRAARELGARELAVPAAAGSTQAEPLGGSAVRVADLAASAAVWAVRGERARGAVARGGAARMVPWMQDRAPTLRSSPARYVLGWIRRPQATPCAEPRATVQAALIAGQAPRQGRAAVPSLARCSHSLYPTTVRWMPTAAPERFA